MNFWSPMKRRETDWTSDCISIQSAMSEKEKRIAAEIDRNQAPVKKQAVETRAKHIELSNEMLEHLAQQKEAAIQRKMKKAAEANAEAEAAEENL